MPQPSETYRIVARKDKNAAQVLYERYGSRLYRYAQASWKLDEDETWDVVYKTLYKVIETTASYTFDSEQKYASFIFRIFINLLRDRYRVKKKENERLERVDYGSVEEKPAREEQAEEDSGKMILLKKELEKLEDWERVLLLMRSQDAPYSEIAKYVNKPAEQLKVYYQRLKATLAKRMHEQLAKKDPNEKV